MSSEQLSFPDNSRPAPAFDRARVKSRLADLTRRGVFIGTSSWKYAGWRGQLYDEQRYILRGRLSEARFEKNCLAEYAEVFKTVCVDAAHYQFPEERVLEGLFAQVPSDFQFTFKVTDEITIPRFPDLPRFGRRAGQLNPNFLNAELFAASFLAPLATHRANTGLLIFQFPRFSPTEYAQAAEFAAALEDFLRQLPPGWKYGVEIRNRAFLAKEYFAVLAQNRVAHIFNSWTDMPPVAEQMAISETRTSAEFAGARLLLQPGRSYEQAVKLFQPYHETKEVNKSAREAAAGLIVEGERYEPRRKTYIYVNNRLEGDALLTIVAILESLFRQAAQKIAESGGS